MHRPASHWELERIQAREELRLIERERALAEIVRLMRLHAIAIGEVAAARHGAA